MPKLYHKRFLTLFVFFAGSSSYFFQNFNRGGRASSEVIGAYVQKKVYAVAVDLFFDSHDFINALPIVIKAFVSPGVVHCDAGLAEAVPFLVGELVVAKRAEISDSVAYSGGNEAIWLKSFDQIVEIAALLRRYIAGIVAPDAEQIAVFCE